MSKREDRKIREQLRRHAELTREYQSHGMTREAASKKAFDVIVKAAAPPSKAGA